MNRESLAFRSRCIREIREFFEEAGYLEVDTPILAKKVIPEPTIELLETTVHTTEDSSGYPAFLLPSPELYMKRLLAAGSGSIFQFSRCFRDFEPASKLHNHEFLMLEWYTVDADYRDSLNTTEQLFARLCRLPGVPKPHIPSLSPPFAKMTIDEAFRKYAGIDLERCNEIDTLLAAIKTPVVPPGSVEEWTELFHFILVSQIEPALEKEKPVVLLDYPEQVPCLAKAKPGYRRERWELYVRGIELANCFSETVSPAEVQGYFKEETARLENAGRYGQADGSFPGLYDGSHPECSGVAMGVDRLIMTLAGCASLAEIMPFPSSLGDE